MSTARTTTKKTESACEPPNDAGNSWAFITLHASDSLDWHGGNTWLGCTWPLPRKHPGGAGVTGGMERDSTGRQTAVSVCLTACSESFPLFLILHLCTNQWKLEKIPSCINYPAVQMGGNTVWVWLTLKICSGWGLKRLTDRSVTTVFLFLRKYTSLKILGNNVSLTSHSRLSVILVCCCSKITFPPMHLKLQNTPGLHKVWAVPPPGALEFLRGGATWKHFNIKHLSNFTKSMPKTKWVDFFVLRWETRLSLRKAEQKGRNYDHDYLKYGFLWMLHSKTC